MMSPSLELAIGRDAGSANSSASGQARSPRNTGAAQPRATTAAWLVIATARGQDALAAWHPVEILRAGFDAHQDHRLAALGVGLRVSASDTIVPEAAPGVPAVPWPECRAGSDERGVEQLVKRQGIDPAIAVARRSGLRRHVTPS